MRGNAPVRLHEINLAQRASRADGHRQGSRRDPELAEPITFGAETWFKFQYLAGAWIEAPRTPAPTCCVGVLKRTSSKLTKICKRHPLLASGPRWAGFNEIRLPQMQPGSSDGSGKVNPVIPEVVNQTGSWFIGLDLTGDAGRSAGQLRGST